MTRWARGGNANKKKPQDASSWEELNQRMGKQRQRDGKVQKKQAVRETVKHKHKQKEKGTFARKDQQKQTFSKDEPQEKQKASTSRVQSSADNRTPYQPSSSGKSLIDDLLEADKKRIVNKVPKETDGCERASDESGSNNFSEMLWKKEKRSEERRLKRQKRKADNMVCFHCRLSGHGVGDCPQMLGDVEQGTGICFRCGSTEHDVSKCTAKVDKKLGEFPYAKCFICQQTGHLSRTCPDNPRGLYPEGGGCKECGSVEHRWWNCPVRKPVKGVDVTSALSVKMSSHTSADAEPAFMSRPKVKVKKTGPKVVMF